MFCNRSSRTKCESNNLTQHQVQNKLTWCGTSAITPAVGKSTVNIARYLIFIILAKSIIVVYYGKSAQSAINVIEFNIKKFEMYDINKTVCLTTMMRNENRI